MAAAPSIVIIGCGNPLRGDDGLGPHVVRLLAQRPCGGDARVRVLDAGTDGMTAMFAARGCRTLVLVDACRSGAEPGVIFDVPGAELAQAPAPAFTLHDFRWDHALYAARRMFAAEFPSEVRVLLVEAQSLALGAGLSASVSGAAQRVAQRIEALVTARLADYGVAA